MWKVGDHLSHRYNSDLGPGRVSGLLGRQVVVEFPDAGETLSFAASSDALVPLALAPHSRARIEATGEVVTVASCAGESCRFADGRELSIHELWPVPDELSPVEALSRGRVGATEDFKNRLDALRLEQLREADGLGSFLGGRIHLFAHQLYAADRACRFEAEHGEPVRWLLADEVGLGKTVEACLIMNRLIHTGKAERTLVVAPDTLVVQWLGELWRKYHQVFVLLDARRLADISRDFGDGFNPFDVHRRAIVSLERLAADRRLTEQAVAAGIDLLVVDEAHRLRRPVGHPGNPAYRAVAAIAGLGRHLLLLTATPLEDDAHGFFRLLQLLRPDELPEEETFARRLRRRQPLPPCTSATRRVDIGGLPPRVAVPVGLDDEGWHAAAKLEEHVRSLPAPHAAAARRKADRVARALASPAALAAVADRGDEALRELLAAAEREDPRLRWLAGQARGWLERAEKTLVFVAHRESLELVKGVLERQARLRVGIFHEDLSPERRDIEVAQFRLADGPAVLVSTESGGEGRNFEFCHRLVLFDLPWNPTVVEQRIGRLDRIGRTLPTEIVYFRPPRGFGRALVALYEAIGLFEEPLGGLERELRHVAREVERVALEGSGEVDPAVFAAVLEEARQAHDRVQEAAYHELHREPYGQDMAGDVLARVPAELDALIEDLVVRAASRFGFEVERQSGPREWLISFGPEALIDHLPQVPAGMTFHGTFDREEAVADETLDFFASGHALVEGVLAELEDGPRGRVALLQIRGDEEVFGLLALYKRGADWEAVAVVGKGEGRPDLAARLTAKDVELEHVEPRKWTAQPRWGEGIRRLARTLPEGEKPQAVAAFRVRSSDRQNPGSTR